MITNEHDLGDALRSVPSPPDLQLDAGQALTTAQRVDRRRRTRRGIAAGLAAAAAGVFALWGTGTAPGPLGVLPAAPWLSACQGITTDEEGTQIDLEDVSYAEVPVTLWPPEEPADGVVALDTCSGGGARLAFALRDVGGGLEAVDPPLELTAEEFTQIRAGARIQPGHVTLGAKDSVRFGVVASDVTDLHALSQSGSSELERESLPGTDLDAFTAPGGGSLEQAIGMAWTDPTGDQQVEWLQVRDVAAFEGDPGETAPLASQDLSGTWHIWLPHPDGHLGHVSALGDAQLGGGTGAEMSDGSYEYVAMLMDGHELVVDSPEDGPAAQIRHAHATEGDETLVWATVPAGGELRELNAQGETFMDVWPVSEP